MAKEDEKEKKGIVSGILNDLAMGFGLKERDRSYYDRTAQTIRNNQGQAAGDRYAARMQSQNYPAYGGPIGFLSGGRGIQGPRDFFDGGGLGQSGDRFRGSPYSLLANALGIKPMGYYDRDRIGQRAGMGALAAMQAGTVPTNMMAPLTAMSQPTPSEEEATLSELTSELSDVPLQPVLGAPTVTGSGKYPQYLYDRGYSDMFLDSLPEQDLEFLLSFNPAGR